jgi:hypothetical protein
VLISVNINGLDLKATCPLHSWSPRWTFGYLGSLGLQCFVLVSSELVEMGFCL